MVLSVVTLGLIMLIVVVRYWPIHIISPLSTKELHAANRIICWVSLCWVHYSDCLYSVVILSAKCLVNCTQCRYIGCHYTDCRGALSAYDIVSPLSTKQLHSNRIICSVSLCWVRLSLCWLSLSWASLYWVPNAELNVLNVITLGIIFLIVMAPFRPMT